MNQVQLLANNPHTGHMASLYMASLVTKKNTQITPHRVEVEPWAMWHCVCLVKTHRLRYIMTYLGHSSNQVIWPDQSQIFKLTLLGQDICVWMRLDVRNTIVFRAFLCLS